MTFKSGAIKLLTDKASVASKEIRKIEDDAKKFSVDCSSDRVYNALVGYREGLREVLRELRSLNEGVRGNRDI
tara:strand:+ start:372 stop:590 length:219 start_codon:yes stop_codon:yes gene_type:complete